MARKRKYSVLYKRTFYTRITVEAESVDGAEDKAYDIATAMDTKDMMPDYDYVSEGETLVMGRGGKWVAAK